MQRRRYFIPPEQDVTLDAASFARLDLNVSRIFITENEIDFLAFPPIGDSMVVFGAVGVRAPLTQPAVAPRESMMDQG
ncbi:MAG: hypothetical protein QOC89_4090, partial [Paraburkholderia sp.]|uniref:Wadjet anti-phage system protein JetD domain-containing protein n=1 Tax=Paraburkholderia sp. TaxID=1926495 RepID=UPI002AFF3681